MENSTLYLQRLRGLLQTEYNAQKEEFRIQTEKMGIRRKVRRGVCWYPVEATKAYYNSLNQYVVEITRQTTNDSDEAEEDKDIENLFEYGRAVQFFSFNAQYPNDDIKDKDDISYFSFTSIISFVDGNRMVATLPSPQAFLDLQSSQNLGVQLYFDETSFKTMFNALDEAIKAKNNRLADLKDIFAGQQKAKKLTFNPMQFPWLNRTQEAAVNEVLWAKDVAVVHGPPGTGKTTTLVEAIYETLHRETQVLVCAQSNMAVDWISEKLVDHGVPVLRIGNPTKVNDKMLSFTYERRFESHPDYPELWSIRHTIRQIRENGKRTESRHQKIARLQERASEIEMRISSQLFSEARVISCTLVGSANKLLVRQKFSTLFIDEAAQALEPACWIAIRRASRVILAGDHQQLPPTIKCYEAMRQGLGKTLMERIVENQPDAVSLLKVQYRMNDAIMRFSSNWFYDGQVESDPSVRHRSILDLEHPIQWIDGSEMLAQLNAEMSLTFKSGHPIEDKSSMLSNLNADTPTTDFTDDDEPLEMDFKEEFIGENHGRINKAEAELVLCTLKDYINKIGKKHFLSERLDVGIISPYRVQTRYIRQQIYHRKEFSPFRHAITVSTVDGFQGQERDIILISLVRSNDIGQIGFLSDLRRMNVAMTRARMKLIIFGDKETMRHHAFYRTLIDYIEDTNKKSLAPC